MPNPDTVAEARRLLYEHFGYSSFRLAQEKLISALLDGQDVLGIMPTGAGKSMCYQIPALMLPGITLVVSPLISLMQDQVRALKAAGIPGAYINSTLSPPQHQKALDNARMGMYKIIYAAPERLEHPAFLRFAQSVDISMVAVDEAHCVSQWGHDFRPSYMAIAPFVARLRQRPLLAAFTATATEAVRADIVELLGLREPETVVTGFDRENLVFRVLRPADKDGVLLRYVRRHSQDSGIVYCSTRKQTERVAALLVENGVSAAAYHAGMNEASRRERQEWFLFDKIQIMVATNAFGMGIDKQNVGFVVHYNMPKSMEEYYQEAGRAGRDGSKAECLLLYGAEDIRMAEFFIRSSTDRTEGGPSAANIRRRMEYGKLEKMKQYCFTGGCLRHYILDYFGETSPERCGNCGNCLAQSNMLAPLRAKSRRSAPRAGKSLYELLRSVRMDFSAKAKLPPELIFSDRTLREMAAQKPQNEYEMMRIPGVSPVKYQMYGRIFLRVIQRNSQRRSGVE